MSHTGTKMSTEFSLHFTLLKISHKRFSKFHNLVDSGCVKTWVCFSFCDIMLKIMFSIVWCKKCSHKSYRNVALLFFTLEVLPPHLIKEIHFKTKRKHKNSIVRKEIRQRNSWLLTFHHISPSQFPAVRSRPSGKWPGNYYAIQTFSKVPPGVSQNWQHGCCFFIIIQSAPQCLVWVI